MTSYESHLKELASTENEEFGDFSIQNRAEAYLLKIEEDPAWVEEVLVSEGKDASDFLFGLSRALLELAKINRPRQVVLQAQFFDLCDNYMFDTVSTEYEFVRHTVNN